MIAHVAEAGESRGRVVVHNVSPRASDLAFRAAVRVAQAFNAEIESLYIEDTELIALAKFPFAREIGSRGEVRAEIVAPDMVRELRYQFSGLHRQLSAIATRAGVMVSERIVRDDALRALAVTCADCGPWNLVVIPRPFTASSGEEIGQLLEQVHDTTGLLLVGPRSSRLSGPVVLALEDIEALPGMLRTGNRLAENADAQVVIACIASDPETASWIEAHARLGLPEDSTARIVIPAIGHAAPAAFAEALRQLAPGFLIARFGGLAVPADDDLGALAAALECPLLLSR